MKIGIGGSRKAPKSCLLKAIDNSPWKGKIKEILSGESGNIDKAAKEYAYNQLIKFSPFPAMWNDFSGAYGPVVIAYLNGRKYNAAAGPNRNQRMVDNADAFIYVWDEISPGTKDCIERAIAKNIPYYIWYYNKDKGEYFPPK